MNHQLNIKELTAPKYHEEVAGSPAFARLQTEPSHVTIPTSHTDMPNYPADFKININKTGSKVNRPRTERAFVRAHRRGIAS